VLGHISRQISCLGSQPSSPCPPPHSLAVAAVITFNLIVTVTIAFTVAAAAAAAAAAAVPEAAMDEYLGAENFLKRRHWGLDGDVVAAMRHGD